MMKLNKNGWGLAQMLIMILVLAVFLFIAIFYIYRLYNTFNIKPTVNYYSKLEEDLEHNATIYLKDYYHNSNDDFIITRDVLRQYNLDVSLVDENNTPCSGYVKVNNKNVKAYIKCDNYTTMDYEE